MARMCIASSLWRDENPESVPSLSTALEAPGYRLKFSSISPDFIFNNAGISVAFIVALHPEKHATPEAWDRVFKMASNFQRCCFMITLTINENVRFIKTCISNRQKLRKMFVMPVRDWSTALQNMVEMVDVYAAYRHRDSIAPETAERLELVSSSDTAVHAICAIPGLEMHDAYSLLYGVGSIEAISRATVESITSRTDLSYEMAVKVVEFFTNDDYNRMPDLS